MSDTALFAGTALRRLRRREGLTQAAMATRLAISPSYLNLIERNQRALSARVLVQVVEQFDFDPRQLREHEAIGGLDGLARRLADERFADLGIDRTEVDEFLTSAPLVAAAFARLYDASGTSEQEGEGPVDQVRHEIERWRNHFADLDTLAEGMADELRLQRGDIGIGLLDRLRERHQLSVRVLPRDVMPDALRRLDLHARQVQLSEMLAPASRNFQIAMQLAELECAAEIGAIADGGRFTDPVARKLYERHLTGYFAAALLMPYGRFLRACESTGYDLPVLRRRFGVSYEQIAHRLTTLQRVGQRGLPFFMARIDRAGQFSKRFAGASGATLLEGAASCPLWIAHRAFERTGELCRQLIAVDGAEPGPAHWFVLARTVEGSGAAGEARFAVVLGIEARLAGTLAQASGLALEPSGAQAIGLGCARCHIAHCAQRSLPPSGAKLGFENGLVGTTPFPLARA